VARPAWPAEAESLLQTQCQALGEDFHLQRGKQVLELKPAAHHKGTVVETFMTEPPFAGRRPVFLGDDVTDEDAFSAVNRLGGYSIRVGHGDHSTVAHHQVDSVEAALDWLGQIARALAPVAGARGC